MRVASDTGQRPIHYSCKLLVVNDFRDIHREDLTVFVIYGRDAR